MYDLIQSGKRRRMKRVGLLLGSFNPLTNAHVALAKGAVKHGVVDESWFVLSPANPAKVNKKVLADEESRRDMMREFLKQENDDTLLLCDIEYDLPRPSYTDKTLGVLKKKYPDIDFYILCGSDTLAKILTWRTGTKVLKENKFICHLRVGTKDHVWSDEVKARTSFVDFGIPELSSTQVRENIFDDQSYKDLVPKSISDYIEQHSLYLT